METYSLSVLIRYYTARAADRPGVWVPHAVRAAYAIVRSQTGKVYV